MSPEKYRKMKSVVKRLEKIALIADAWEMKLSNGGEIGNMLNEIANDLEQQTQKIAKSAAVRNFV